MYLKKTFEKTKLFMNNLWGDTERDELFARLFFGQEITALRKGSVYGYPERESFFFDVLGKSTAEIKEKDFLTLMFIGAIVHDSGSSLGNHYKLNIPSEIGLYIIQENNGWIKRTFEFIIPKDDGFYEVVDKDEKQYVKEWNKLHQSDEKYSWKNITHFKSIKSKSPMY